ncbi:RNA polymerase sigma factor [Emticicia oligotrophica]|uniref:RNA polymerase sigma factor n=1 Tax=Emticicia oligotrophica TaxID=312279 RepID=UPI00273B52EB|nr:RNA polymerase sigma factor [Emticicia oligotrophica]
MITATTEIYFNPLTRKPLLNSNSLMEVVEDCLKGKESAMKKFYEHFHGFALSVCLSYCENRDDALEVMNDGFLKVFKSLDKVENIERIKPWLRRIMINVAIDHYRKNIKNQTTQLPENIVEPNFGDTSVYAKLSSEDIMEAVQSLPTNYRLVFNLYAIEGYSHKEIGEMLKMAESTSRANLSLANGLLREKLRKML